MTARLFTALLEKNGLTLVRQFDSWGVNGRFNLTRYSDCISRVHFLSDPPAWKSRGEPLLRLIATA